MKLSDSVQYLKGVGPRMKEKLERLGIHTVEDLLSYFPRRYQDWTKVTPMGDLVPDEEAVVYGEVVGLKEIHPRGGAHLFQSAVESRSFSSFEACAGIW